MCSSKRHGECGTPCGLAPRNSIGRCATAASKRRWAPPACRRYRRCSRNSLFWSITVIPPVFAGSRQHEPVSSPGPAFLRRGQPHPIARCPGCEFSAIVVALPLPSFDNQGSISPGERAMSIQQPPEPGSWPAASGTTGRLVPWRAILIAGTILIVLGSLAVLFTSGPDRFRDTTTHHDSTSHLTPLPPA